MKSLKLLVITLSIAMLMAVSACASTPPGDPPNLSESQVIKLARESEIARGHECWRTEGTNPARFYKGGKARSTASYDGNGLWGVYANSHWKYMIVGEYMIVGRGVWQRAQAQCSLIVDEKTKEVRWDTSHN